MNDAHRWLLLESRLRTEVIARCERAFVHDARNSLQAVAGGVEAMARALLTGSQRIPPERIIELTRLALSNHERTMQEMLAGLANASRTHASTEVDALLRALTAFLVHDARQRGLDFDTQLLAPCQVDVDLSRVRLVLLALLIDSIDASPAQTRIGVVTSLEGTNAVITITDERTTQLDDPWHLEADVAPTRQTLTLPVSRHLIEGQNGALEIQYLSRAGQTVRVVLSRIAT